MFEISFTEREIEIAKLARKEYTNKETAKELKIHVKTVEMHKQRLLDKTGSKKMIGVIDYMLSAGILPLKII